MLKTILKTTGFIVVSIILLSIANDLLTYRIPRDAGVEFGKYYEYSGVINIHTRYSDGSGTYEQIGKTCDSLGLHFAIITDLNTVQPMKDHLDKRFGITLLVPAEEVSTDDEHRHFLVIGDSIPLVPGDGISSDSVFHDALGKGDMVILADIYHPHKTLDWDNRGIGTFTGMELYNFEKGWRSALSLFQINKLIGTYCVYGFRPQALNYLLEYPSKEMKKFDELNMTRKVIGVGSLGAHANLKLGKNIHWHIPSYVSLFNLVHTVIVTKTPFNGSYHHDRELLLGAIRNGNTFVAFSGLEHARGFLFTATSDTTAAIMGDSLRLYNSAKLNITLPDSNYVETQIIRNGKIIGTYYNVGGISLVVSKPGEYRIQAFQKRTMLPFFTKRSFPWILSNPIYVYR